MADTDAPGLGTQELEFIELFVPGRVCLLGEHTDWAGRHRKTNPEIGKGACLLVGTEQGLKARTRKLETPQFVFRTVDSGKGPNKITFPLEKDALVAIAKEGGFFSYVAGVAFIILSDHPSGIPSSNGILVEVISSDLPVKKGLSSSAAVCVLVTRAFNKVFNLNLDIRAEMDIAFRGETTTPSRCGTMDQAGCAYGNVPILTTFDGDDLQVEKLQVGADLHFVVVDLLKGKDTVRILADLQSAFPFPQTDAHRAAHSYLGQTNEKIVGRAISAIRAGDATLLGALMDEAQKEFDVALTPLCPSQLTSPALHLLLEDQEIRRYVWGGKGVGSQGDGAAQFIARGPEEQKALLELLKKRGLQPLPLTIPKNTAPAKSGKFRAVITAAGSGTRLFPATKLVRKEFLPVPDDHDGLVKPLIWKHIEELLSAGVNEVILVVREGEEEAFCHFFQPTPPELLAKLSEEARKNALAIAEAGNKIRFAVQKTPNGLGHAVLQASSFCPDGHVAVILGDHWFRSTTRKSCVEQVLEAHGSFEGATIGLAVTPERDLHRFGFVAGNWVSDGVLDLKLVSEKPDKAFAEKNLKVEGILDGNYLSVFGVYLLPASILFSELAKLEEEKAYERGELQLTTALESIRKRDGMRGCVVKGTKTDVGTPELWERMLLGD